MSSRQRRRKVKRQNLNGNHSGHTFRLITIYSNPDMFVSGSKESRELAGEGEFPTMEEALREKRLREHALRERGVKGYISYTIEVE